MRDKKTRLTLLFSVAIFIALSFFVYANLPAGRQEALAVAPPLKEGTYLTGQTLSVWPSWSLLGNTLGQALPVDPINELAPAGTCVSSTNKFCLNNNDCPSREACVLHDPNTGWSTADRRFSFACNKDSYAYRYIVSTTPGIYTVRALFEDTGITPANLDTFISKFVSTSIVKINDGGGVCAYDQEISTMQSGVCGDGKLNLNKGEQCDPPGTIVYQTGCVGPIKNLTVCNSGCQWVNSTTLCSSLSRCGNGVKESGETCDDGGVLNGKYNHCNATCNGISSLGSCGDGAVTSTYEICDPGPPGGVEKYSPSSKTDSCSWDCQNWGPYCGDSIAQTQFGEECDGSQTCSVDGNPGTKVCASNCQKEDRDAVAWWRLEQLGLDVFSQYKTADASVNANFAKCTLATCPVVGAGKYGRGFEFSSALGNRFLTVINNASLLATSSVTVEAWIYPTNNGPLYQKIVEKKNFSKGYDLEFNASSTAHNVRFNLWNGSQTSVDSNSTIITDTWTHVVGTYERIGTINTAKIYVNGNLENTNVVDFVEPIMMPSTANLAIGKSSPTDSDFFFGSMDEVKIYNRALSAAEIQNNYQSGWFCAATSTPPVVPVASGSCGDNVIDASEACDRGAANNGQACVPAYGAPCSYCSADCQNTIEVQPAQYCGNGIIESLEKCEVADGVIYAATSTVSSTLPVKNLAHNGYQERACSDELSIPAHTIKKGTKTCGDCSVGIVKNCVKCGPDAGGVGVEGGIINALNNHIGDDIYQPLDPLYAKLGVFNSSLIAAIGNCDIYEEYIVDVPYNICAYPSGFVPDSRSTAIGKAIKDITSSDLVSYTLLDPYKTSPTNALISSAPSCSFGDDPNYRMYVNEDWTRPRNFSVVAEPQTWQYDMVLSPIVSSSPERAKDLRIVASWVGPEDFYGGVLDPFIAIPELEDASWCGEVGTCLAPVYTHATGINYFTDPNPSDAVYYKQNGIWAHGFSSTPGQTSAEAFTIDTAAMDGNTYSFYLRSPGYPIKQFKNTAKLKVDVYLPENDNNPYHFGTPAKTYYFNAATPSDNLSARYWQVFNVNKPTSNLSLSDIIDVNAIVTGPAYFQYVTLTPPPDTSIISSSYVPGATAVTFTFSGHDSAGASITSFQCKLNGGAFQPCTSGISSFSPLIFGWNTFQVRSVDSIGNIDPSPATSTWYTSI